MSAFRRAPSFWVRDGSRPLSTEPAGNAQTAGPRPPGRRGPRGRAEPGDTPLPGRASLRARRHQPNAASYSVDCSKAFAFSQTAGCPWIRRPISHPKVGRESPMIADFEPGVGGWLSNVKTLQDKAACAPGRHQIYFCPVRWQGALPEMPWRAAWLGPHGLPCGLLNATQGIRPGPIPGDQGLAAHPNSAPAVMARPTASRLQLDHSRRRR